MDWPRIDDLDQPARGIVAGALSVVQGLVVAGADPVAVQLAVKAARDVRTAVGGRADPQNCIEEHVLLEGKLWLS